MSSLLHAFRRRQLHRRSPDRQALLARTLRRLVRARAPRAWSTLWTDAIYAWDNERWSAEEEYLAEVVRSAERARGTILECGSGLTTLLIAAVAARTGARLHSLEHNPTWHARVDRSLRDAALSKATVHLAEMRDFGDFEWYDAPLPKLPGDFALVVCDGPPASTRGGRSGLMRRMREKLMPGCIILLDDLTRPAEQELLKSWIRDFKASPEMRASSRGFARVRIPGA